MRFVQQSRCMRHVPLAVIAPLLSGCSHAPSIDIMGSFFPAWLVCLVMGIALTAVVRVVLLRFQLKLAMPVLAYPCLAAFLTFFLWLLFFY